MCYKLAFRPITTNESVSKRNLKMSSLVTELLSSAGQLAKDDLKTEIAKLSKRVEFVKNEVMETLNSIYGEFHSYFTESSDLHRRLNVASNEAQTARSKLEEELRPQLGGLVSKYEDVTEDLEKTTVMLSFLKTLSVVHAHFQEAERAEKRHDYTKAASCVEDIRKELSASKYGCEADIKILRVLKTEQLLMREKLIYDMNEVWNEHVTWSVHTSSDKRAKEAVLSIGFSSYLSGAASVVEGLIILNQLSNNIKNFGRNLMKTMLEPVILYSSTVTTESKGEVCQLVVSSQNTIAETTEVFRNLRLIFEFLHDTFLNSFPDKNETIMNYLGEFFGQAFCEDLTKDCINPAIPSDSKDLEKYEELVNNLADLERYLQDIGFLTAENIKILSYAKNVDILFANKKCQEILCKARDIMQRELHITETVPLKTESSKFPVTVKTEPTENLEFQSQIKSLDDFPQCQVSTFVIDLLDLLHKVLLEARNGTPASVTRMYYMTRHICDLFCDTVPVFHRDNITMYPQQTAIHHNNCMYFAHSILTLGHRYRRSLPLPADMCMTYTDLVLKIRTAGIEAFLEQMRRQRQQLMEFLKEGGILQNLSEEANLDSQAERMVKKVLHLLSSLKSIWSSVLPQSVYLKAIGNLTNSCVEEITSLVLCQEDITENVASQLNSLFEMIEEEIPNLFRTKEEEGPVLVHKYVPKWQRFLEMKLMVVSSLHEIVNRWANGKGPLAVEFKAEEVKHLIRALFQNTDRRATALAKIR